MKTHILLRLKITVILLITCFSCSKKKYKSSVKGIERSNTVELPKSGKELYFNISLKENSRYQPMHTEICSNRGFVILGNFHKNERVKDSINFFVLNTHSKDSTYIKIDSVRLGERNNKMIKLKVYMNKTRQKDSTIAPLVLDHRIASRDTLDLKLYLEKRPYEDFTCRKYQNGDKNVGDHICKSLVIEE